MKNKLSIITFISLIIGIIFGLFFSEHTDSISFIGTFYIDFLKYLIVPIVFTSVTVSIYDSRKLKNKLVLKSVVLFVLMFVITFVISSLIITIINPSKGFVFETIDWQGATTDILLQSVIANLIPKDFKRFLTGAYLFFVIVMSFVVGYVSSLSKSGQSFIETIRKIKEYLFMILEYFMYFTPFAVFSLMASTVSKYGSIFLGVGFRYIITAYICALIALILVMIVPVLVIRKMSPLTYLHKISKIWLMTITTCSSSATLPYTIKTCKEEFEIPEKITDVVVPLGCTIHMCGGAVSFALLGLFCSKLFGVEITFVRYMMMLAYAVLINMAAPGIPNGGVVVGATYLQLLGIPLDFIGFYSGIYKLLDMVYTTLNVTGDITANVIIDSIENK